MRRATRSTMWLLSDDGSVQGLSLGSDSTAEHEWGVDGLRSTLGVKKTFENGVADRVSQKVPPVFYKQYTLDDGTPAAYLSFGSSYSRGLLESGEVPPYLAKEVSFFGPHDAPDAMNLSCAWDDQGILIHVRTQEQVDYLEQFKSAIERKDIAFGGDLLDEKRFYRAGGLIFVIPSRIDPRLAQQAYEKDQSLVRLRQAAEKIGLDKELRAAGKRWFALSPRWKDKQESEVVYWLNPQNQQDYSSGLYTADELRQWANEKGPVIIDKPLRELNKKHEKRLRGIRKRMEKQGFEDPWLRIEWKDEEKSSFVVRPHYWKGESKSDKVRIEERDYDISELEKMFPKPPPKPRAKKSIKP